MHFAHPDNLYLLLLLVPMVLALAGYFWWKRRLMARVGHSHLIRAMSARHSNRRQVVRGILIICATALLCVAAAQPQWGQDDRTIKRFGVDVVFALDLSNSMLAQDIPPNRLQAAKDEIETSLTTLAGDRVGLVVFTAISFAQSPLTTDYGAIRFYLDKLQAGQMPVGGTSLGQAILDSVELLTGDRPNGDGEDDKAGGSKKVDRAKNQVIVLFTDGEDHESSPIEAARQARERGIHVVTVGLGSPDGARIPIRDDNGQLKGYKRDQRGELVYTKLDDKTLEKIAAESGGTYLAYSGENSVVNGLKDYIDRLEKSELETMLRKRYKDRFMYFVAPALVLLLLALFLGERRTRAKGAPSRAGRSSDGRSSDGRSSDGRSSDGRSSDGSSRVESRPNGDNNTDMKKTSSSLLVLLLLGSFMIVGGSVGCDGAFRTTVDEVDEANALISSEEYEQALEKYREAESKVPASPELHYNRGIALLGADKFDEARESFARALETRDEELHFDALFNLGLSLAGQEKWKEAYETYKEALRVDLDLAVGANEKRVEKARHNLEVVFRTLFPPCSALEDELEENDGPEAASKLENLKKKELSLCGLDEDWFVIPATVGTSVSVEAGFSVLRDEPDPEHVFLPRHQDLQIAVFDATGEEVLAVDQGEPETFEPDTKHASRSIDKFTVTPEMVDGGNGHLFLKVSATDQREFSYDVEVTAIPPCRALEDDFEQNDTADTARTLTEPNNELHICSGDDDWFEFDLELGDTLFVDVQVGEDRERERPAALSMEIVRKDTGKVVATGHREEPYLTAGVQNVMEPGTYLVRVFGQTDDEQGPYTLDVYQYEPCVVGDDRFEDNDSAQQAAGLDPKVRVHRYLRLCDLDRDFFRLPAPQDDPDAQKSKQQSSAKGDKQNEVAWGLATVADGTSEDAAHEEKPDESAKQDKPEPPTLDLMSASGAQIVAEGVVPEIVEKPKAAGQDEQTPPQIDRVVRHQNEDKEELLLRVEGAQTFYHLTQLNPQDQQQNQKDEQDDQKKQDDQEKQDDQKKQDDQQKKDDQKKKDEQDKKEKEDKSQDKDDEKEEKQDEPKDSEDKDKEDAKEQEARRPEPKKDPEEQRAEDILRALEQTDDNFQMKKALEDMPKRYIEKDW